MSIVHEWEREAPVHAWDGGSDSGNDRWSDDEAVDADSPEAAAEEWMSVMLDLCWSRSITAGAFCQLCYWASKAGIEGLAGSCGQRPGLPSGHYQRHLDKALGFRRERANLYKLEAPSLRRHDRGRSTQELLVVNPHEALGEYARGDPTIVVRLHDRVALGVPPAWSTHPVWLESAGEAVPLSLFVDGVPYSHTDSVIGFWILNEVTKTRHVCAVLRKRTRCACGCRGWCSFWPLFDWLRWSFECLATRIYPACRHDFKDFDAAHDADRIELVGKPMLHRYFLLYIKGDWSEYCSTFGFPTWQSSYRPCLFCACPPAELYSVRGLSLHDRPWHENDDDDFERACSRCEIRVVVNAHTAREIWSWLDYDRRPNGSHGLCLKRAIPALGLEEGDRLEPSRWLPDVGKLRDCTMFPAPLLFWRSANQTAALHRCPLFDASLGITPGRSMTCDTLHVLYLGVFKQWVWKGLWHLLQANIWRAPETCTADERVLVQITTMRSELDAWYKARHARGAAENLTRAHDVTPKMVGAKDQLKLSLSGAETWGVLLYLVEKMETNAAAIGADGRDLCTAGKCCVRFIELLRESPYVVPNAVLQGGSGWR